MSFFNIPNATVLSEIVKEYSISSPDKIAINDGIKAFTFYELETFSEKIAQNFIDLGIKKNDRICIIAHKCSEIILYAIAIWKCGAIYTPVDPELPEERLTNLLENIQPHILIRSIEYDRDLSVYNITHIIEFDFYSHINTKPDIRLPEVSEEDNAIIIHTSGSTGLPKGVVLQHKSVIAYFTSHRYLLKINNNSRCLNTSSFHYDVSIQDTFQPLYFGAYIYLYKFFFIPSIVLPLLIREKISLLTAISTILTLITGDLNNLDKYKFPDLKVISFGAEVCSVKLLNKWLTTQPGLTIVNGYGPSEVNSVSISYSITEADEARREYYPIGKAHTGVNAILVDVDNAIINKPDIDGEILLGGPQLMNYYWNNPIATEKAFVFINNEKFYKTGDLCFYDKNQDLVYKGRKDFEIKYNGRRINMTEITSIVQDNFDFKYVDCHLVNDNGDYSLVLIIQIDNYTDLPLIKKNILAVLRHKLPDHSIPSVFSFYNTNLQISSGKINRKLLTQLIDDAVKLEKSDVYVYINNIFITLKKSYNEIH